MRTVSGETFLEGPQNLFFFFLDDDDDDGGLLGGILDDDDDDDDVRNSIFFLSNQSFKWHLTLFFKDDADDDVEEDEGAADDGDDYTGFSFFDGAFGGDKKPARQTEVNATVANVTVTSAKIPKTKKKDEDEDVRAQINCFGLDLNSLFFFLGRCFRHLGQHHWRR